MSQNDWQEALVANTAHQVLSTQTIWFVLTNLCNINCHYCFNYISKNHEHMSPELGLAILKYYLDYHEQNGIKHPYVNVHFFGGEPTLNPEALLTMMDYLNEKKVRCFPMLFTNGIIKEDVLDKIIERKMFFRLSFDGVKNSLRFTKSGKGDINPQIIRSIEKIRSADQPIQIRATIHAANVEDMCQVITFAAEHEVKEVAFFPTYMDGNARIYPVQQASIGSYVKNFIKAVELAKTLNISVQGDHGHILKNKNSHFFDYPLVWLPDGFLSPTVQFASSRSLEAKNAILGKFCSDTNSIEINENKIIQMGNNFYANREINCSGCEFKQSCQGTKRFDAYALNDPIKSQDDYFCEIARRLVKHNS